MSRRPVHKRDKDRTVKLQDRDLEILKALYYYRMLTTTQIYQAFFDSLKTAQVRMRKLFDAKLAGRIFRPTVFGTEEVIYILTRGASELVSKEYIG